MCCLHDEVLWAKTFPRIFFIGCLQPLLKDNSSCYFVKHLHFNNDNHSLLRNPSLVCVQLYMHAVRVFVCAHITTVFHHVTLKARSVDCTFISNQYKK